MTDHAPQNVTSSANPTMSRRQLLALTAALGGSVLFGGLATGCSSSASSAAASKVDASALAIPNAWKHDTDNDVYYQIGLPYCTKPAASDYESYAICVPGAYLDATANGDGTFSCTLNEKASVAGYTAATAPVVMPINTAGYSAQEAMTAYNYSSIADYIEAGFVYVFAGCRGRNNVTDGSGKLLASGGAPWGVTDLKAAVRALRYNAASLPGSTDRIFSLGHSGGGAQSAVLGVAGDAEGYSDYLASIGAATEDAAGNALSDAIAGSMCWCPITNLSNASEAYEWNMGQFATTGTRASGTFTEALSKDMAEAWATYVNGLGLVGEDGTKLALEKSSEGVYCAGTYYDYIVDVVEESLNDFLRVTEFPYTPSSTTMGDMGAGGAAGGAPSEGGSLPSGEAPTSGGGLPSGEAPDGDAPSGGSLPSGDAPDGDAPSGDVPDSGAPSVGAPGAGAGAGADASASDDAATYETVEAYIAALNETEEWVTYDSATNTAHITGLSAFARLIKTPSKDVGAFDALDCSQAENALFGNDDSDSLHFDATMAQLLSDNKDAYASLANWDSSYPASYKADYEDKLDSLGKSSQSRQDIYNPMYFLCEGGSSKPAGHWRIRTGITQGDTALTTEVNLALALKAKLGASAVDFATIWGQGHTTAELEGSSTENFIAWVNGCCA